MKPAVVLIELSSIARGLVVTDQMVKKAPVEVLSARTISPGKYIILVTGDVASCEESIQIGKEVAGSYLVDSLFIPHVHEQVLSGLKRKYKKTQVQSLAVVETQSVASTIVALDRALKTAEVTLIQLKCGQGIGGKGFFVLNGALAEVEAAVNAASQILRDGSHLLQTEVIAHPHADTPLEMGP